MESIDLCIKAAEASTTFELNNTELKRQYLLQHILLFNNIINKTYGSRGSFGTGYPFYALGQNLTGTLPIIEEQLRYNNELISEAKSSNITTWHCAECLAQCQHTMPDLKQVCKPCPNMANTLKPRKVINRLPDMDMWMVCDENSVDIAQQQLIDLFNSYGLHTSDINPVDTIHKIIQISNSIAQGIIPDSLLPIDAHIIEYSKLAALIERVPYILKQATIKEQVPYLPIHPLSYRKTWQYDDAAYNFVHDYLSSFTEYNFDEYLSQLLMETRNQVASEYSFDELYNFLISTGPESVLKRHRTKELKDRFKERMDSWKK